MQQGHSKSDGQKEKIFEVSKKQKKIKKSILKRNNNVIKIPKFLCLQNYFQLSEAMIINQSSLKDPQNSTQSFLTNTFYFKRIGSLLITPNILELNLKDIISPRIPINYFIERYRSFGNRQFNNLSLLFQKLVAEFGYIAQSSLRNKQSIPDAKFFQNVLYSYIQTISDKKYVCFFYEPGNKGFCLKKLIFSRKLLELVGLDIQQIKEDYLKHKHIFFQIFGCQTYKKFMIHATQNLTNVLQKSRLGQISIQQAMKASVIQTKNYIQRRKMINHHVYEQEIQATIKFYKPQSFITIIQICDINENNTIRIYPLTKKMQQLTIHQQEKPNSTTTLEEQTHD